MAVSIAKRPLGPILGYTEGLDKFSNVSIIQSGPAAIVGLSAHGRVNGDIVYVKSNVDNYNGLWYVEVASVDSFKLNEYVGSSDVAYIKDATATVYFAQQSWWSCVHLPIVFKLSNTRWPENSEDTVRTISSVTDSNGYCALGLSGDIKNTGSAAALEFVKITNSSDDELNGVWQIVAYTNDTTFTIATPYSSANDTSLTGASIQYYYSNYHAKVQIWAGLVSSHEFYTQKPSELLTTLDVIPDDSNLIIFSISDILKAHINIRNNLLLGTLPNNLDAYTQFFIKYAESYDVSDGTTLGLSAPSYTDDSSVFVGYAVNSKLPFKSVHSGSLAEYSAGDSTTKFLSDFAVPTIFDGRFFDVSFINIYSGVGLSTREKFYLNGSLITTEETDLTTGAGYNAGVYRAPLTTSESICDYDRVDVDVIIADTAELLNGHFTDGSNYWSNAGSGQTWSFSGEASVTVTGTQSSKRLEHSYNFYAGVTYQLDWYIERGFAGGADNFLVTAYLSNDNFTVTQTVGGEGPYTTNGSASIVDTFTASANYTKLVFIVTPNVA